MTSGDAVDAPKAEEARKVPSYMETLSEDVKERITSLQEIQKKHDEIEAEFQKEKAALYAKYEKLYAPFYEQRATIVNGSQEPAVEASKGVPDFWLNALKSNTLVAMQITEKDQEALKYLKDIRSYILTEPRGFKLEFHFAENPFFSNAVLTKEYQMADDEEPILEKAIGTNIDWKEGKNLTVKLMKKKAKKGSKDPPKVKLADCESFFNFFKPPDVPDNDDDLTSEEMEDLQDLLEQDYDIGSTIREKIVPHAISWFTGEAADDFDDEEEEEEEEDEDYDEEDDEDEDDEESDEDEDEEAPALLKKEDKPE